MILGDLQSRLGEGSDLTLEETHAACALLLDGSVAVEKRAGFLRALHRKGETPAEIAAFVEVLLDRAMPVSFSGDGCIDVCGTGGDRSGIFNVSTAVMFVAAACGARVVKHGNRGITSKSGGADVLEALGVGIELPPDGAARALDAAGCCFLFAPAYHPAFKAVAPVRKFLADEGGTSIFNMLGPLLNPARPSFQLAGVFDPLLLPAYAGGFRLLGRERAWAVHGLGPGGLCLDEVSPFGETRVIALDAGDLREFSVRAGDLGIAPPAPDELAGGTAAVNAGILSDILAGNLRGGARTIVQLNAAAALVVAGICDSLAAGLARAGEAIDDGSARDVLGRLRACR